MQKVYYHTYLFPFTWESKDVKLEEVFEGAGNCVWKKSEKIANGSCIEAEKLKRSPGSYDAFHYFNEPARDLFFCGDSSVLKGEFRISKEFLKGMKYYIQKKEKSKTITYMLDISKIFIQIYDTKIAMLGIVCVNHSYFSLRQVKEINEYGRRLALPFWPTNREDNGKCADCLGFKVNAQWEKYASCLTECMSRNEEGRYITDDFKGYMKEGLVSYSYISKCVRALLDCNDKNYVFRAKEPEKKASILGARGTKKEIQIKPLLDEKMFVCCMMVDQEMVKQLLSDYNQMEKCFSDEVYKNLFELVDVDIEGSYESLNMEQMTQRFHEQLYLKEFVGDKPKIMATSEQMFLRIVANNTYDAEYFDNCYCRIIALVLVQRMSIARFQYEISNFMKRVCRSKKGFRYGLIKDVIEVQHAYITFQNRYLMREISVKSDGRYLYNSALNSLNVIGANEGLSNQMQSLYELVTTYQGDLLSKGGFIITVVMFVLTAVEYLLTADSVGKIDWQNFDGWIVLIGTFIIFIGCVGYGIVGSFFSRNR